MIKYYNVDTEDLKKNRLGGGIFYVRIDYTLIFRKSPEFTLILQHSKTPPVDSLR